MPPVVSKTQMTPKASWGSLAQSHDQAGIDCGGADSTTQPGLLKRSGETMLSNRLRREPAARRAD